MMRNPLSLLAAVLLLFPILANAGWNKDWTVRQKITLNAQAVSGAVTQAAVVVRLHSGNFSFMDARPDGADLRIVAADDKTELKFHIEKFDSLNELAILWVQLPKVDPGDKTAHFWLYYGNEQAGPAQDGKGTWDSNTAAVFHFGEKAQLQDASASGLAATGNISAQKAALLGEAAIFSDQPIRIAAAPALKLAAGGGFTYSAWIRPGALPQQATLYRQGPLAIRIDGQKLALVSGRTAISGGEIKAAIWQHVAATVGGGKATLYMNGVPAGSADMTLEDTQAEVVAGEGYSGEMDELELANVARSGDWIKLAVQGQGVDSQLLKVEKDAAEGAEEDGGTSYFGVLFRSLTTDAWVVIIILSFMFVISAMVMAAKAMLIIRTDKGNRHFIEHFHNASDNLLDLERSASHPDSTLFRLYVAGLREIRKRYTNGNELALSGSSMDAIKAAIDADLVRETQKLNARMVLLTIAISGGPFLGLLGTVVGVMITFAAIAAAGDVNVNAIAPGIAAALLATVAGLAVAIPALFGYNYLASRIKNITVDMQIFVDEFVTRAAELYGR